MISHQIFELSLIQKLFFKNRGSLNFSEVEKSFIKMPVEKDMNSKIDILADWIKTQDHLPQHIGKITYDK